MNTMPQSHSPSSPSHRLTGWIAVSAIVLFYAALYIANYLLPPGEMNYTTRIWNWSQTSLMIAAGCITLWNWRSVKLRPTLLGLVLAVLSGFSHAQHDPSLTWSFFEGLAVWFCFVAGSILFERQPFSVSAFKPPLANASRSIGLGILLALPLALINNLYFYLNAGAIHFQDLLASAFEALSPAIHEEIIFRFFVLALVLRLLQFNVQDRRVMPVAVFMAVVPHSLNHLPELFLDNPVMGLLMLVATSLLFGLPMALLQIKRNLEASIAFHWFIDFTRFWFGY